MPSDFDAEAMLPAIFMGLMGLSMLAYVILDGFDLGVGMLLAWGTNEQKDLMVSSIGPFWDANETWLITRADGALQDKAIGWAKRVWPLVVVGLRAISIATVVALMAVRAPLNAEVIRGRLCWTPFALVVLVFVLGFLGLAYSLYPYVVIDRITIWEAASAPKSLWVILIGTAISVPAIVAYTIFAYRVFWGKTTAAIHYG